MEVRKWHAKSYLVETRTKNCERSDTNKPRKAISGACSKDYEPATYFTI